MAAFEELGLGSYVFDLSPDQLESALRRLDAMIAGWSSNGIRISYPLPDNPQDSDIDVPSGVPDWCNEAIFLNLAVRLAPQYGKSVTPDTKMLADMSYNNMTNQTSYPTPERVMPGFFPRGAGQKAWRSYGATFTPANKDSVLAGSDSELTLE